MSKEIFNGVKFGVGIIISLSIFLGIVYAVGFHNANEILPGIFTGDYTFNGTISFSDGSNLSSAPTSQILQIKHVMDLTEVTTTSTSVVDMGGGRTVNFTPTRNDSIIHILYSDTIGGELTTSHGITYLYITRGTIASGSPVYIEKKLVTRNNGGSSGFHFRYAGYLEAWDLPQTTETIQYNIAGNIYSGGELLRLGEGTSGFANMNSTTANNRGSRMTIIEYSGDIPLNYSYAE